MSMEFSRNGVIAFELRPQQKTVGDRKSAVFVGDSCSVLCKKKRLHLWRLPLLRSVGVHLVHTACKWQMMKNEQMTEKQCY